MTFEEALTAKVATVTALTDLIGTRFYPDAAPQGETGDYLIYQLSNRDDPPPLDGSANGLVKETVEFTAYSANRLRAGQIRDAVIAAFNGVAARGAWGGAYAVRSCVCESASAGRDPPADGSETGDRAGRVTLNVWWKRA